MMTGWSADNISTAGIVLLLLSFLRATKASLEDTWKIDGPHVHLSHGSNAKAFQLQYFVSNKAKNARYSIFQDNCEQTFEEGTEVVRGNGQVVTTIAAPVSKEEEEEDDEAKKASPSYTMTINDNPSGDGQIASVKLVPTTSTTKTVAPRSSSMFGWVSRLYSWITGDDKNVLHFCMRVGLWLPPEAGEHEVNFRETNVQVTLGGDDGKTIQRVELEARPMNPVQVHIMGGKVTSGGDPIQKEDDEGDEAVEKQGESLEEETEDTATSKEQEGVENNEASNNEL